VTDGPLAERGAVTDEYVAAFRTPVDRRQPKIDGRYVHYDGLVLEPKPMQQPHPPIWVGGERRPSMRRARAPGDAWYPIGKRKQRAYADTLTALQAGVARLAPLTAAARARSERRRADLPRQTLRRRGAADRIGRQRRLFSGSDADLVADISGRLRDLGVAAIDFDFDRPAPRT